MWRRYWAQEAAKKQAEAALKPEPPKENKAAAVLDTAKEPEPVVEQKDQEQPAKQKKSKE